MRKKVPEGSEYVDFSIEGDRVITEWIPKESERVTNYEDALMVLQKKEPTYLKDMPKHVQAYYKLCTICEALNLGHTKEERVYYSWWYTKELHAGVAARASVGGLAFASASSGFRLCSFDKATALYLGSERFIKLWKEYLL